MGCLFPLKVAMVSTIGGNLKLKLGESSKGMLYILFSKRYIFKSLTPT